MRKPILLVLAAGIVIAAGLLWSSSPAGTDVVAAAATSTDTIGTAAEMPERRDAQTDQLPWAGRVGDVHTYSFQLDQEYRQAPGSGGQNILRPQAFGLTGSLQTSIVALAADAFVLRATIMQARGDTPLPADVDIRQPLFVGLTVDGRIRNVGPIPQEPAGARIMFTLLARSHQFLVRDVRPVHELVDDTGPCRFACGWDGIAATRTKETLLRTATDAIDHAVRVVRSTDRAVFADGWLDQADIDEELALDVGGIASTVTVQIRLRRVDRSREPNAGPHGVPALLDVHDYLAMAPRPADPVRSLGAILDDFLELAARAQLEGHAAQQLHAELARLLAQDANALGELLAGLRNGALRRPRVPFLLSAMMLSAIGAAAEADAEHCMFALADLIDGPPEPDLRLNALAAGHRLGPTHQVAAQAVQAAAARVFHGTDDPADQSAAALLLASLHHGAGLPDSHGVLQRVRGHLLATDRIELLADVAGNSGDLSILGDVPQVAAHPRDTVREALADCLGQFPLSPQATRTALGLLQDPAPGTRAAAAGALARHPAALAVPALVHASATDSSVEVRLRALQSLGHHWHAEPGSATVRTAIVRAMDADPDPAVRTAAQDIFRAGGPGHLARR